MKTLLLFCVLFFSPLALAKDLSKVRSCQLHHEDSCRYYDCHGFFKNRFYKVCENKKIKMSEKEWLDEVIKPEKTSTKLTTQDGLEYQNIEIENYIQEERKGGQK